MSSRIIPRGDLPSEVVLFLDMLAILRNRPPTTVRAYRSDLAKFVIFVERVGPWDITRVDRDLLLGYQAHLARAIPLPRSRARTLVALRQFLRYAHEQEWMQADLARFVTVPRYVIGDPHPVPTDRVGALLHALPHDTFLDARDRALIHFLIATGCRISEACQVNRTDVRLDGFRVLGKGGKHRTVYLTEPALRAISDYLVFRGDDKSPALFINGTFRERPGGHAHKDNRLTPDGARYALRALRERHLDNPGLTDLLRLLPTPHAARHTTATTLLEATEGDVRLVQEILGHATLETLRVYTEITDKRKRAAYARLHEFIDGQPSGAP